MLGIWDLRIAICIYFVHYTPTECFVQNVSERCTPTSCLVLYKDNGESGMTWEDSGEYCGRKNMELTSIPDETTQQAIGHMLSNAHLNGGTKVWVAGSRRMDMTWQYLNQTKFSPGARRGDVGGCSWFEKVNQLATEDYIIKSENCNEHQSHSRTVCQFLPSQNANISMGTCHNIPHCSSSFKHRSLCYAVCDGRRNDTWYTAQTYCRTKVNGDLVAIDINDTTLTNKIFKDVMSPNKKIWTGIIQHPWIWNGSSGSLTMRYYNWYSSPSIPPANTYGQCVQLNPQAEWANVDCSMKYQYFLCSKDPLGSSTVPSTTQMRLVTAVTADSSITNQSIGNSTLIPPDGENIVITAVASSVAVVVVAVIIAVVVAVVVKKRKEKSNHQYVNSATPSRVHRGTDDPSAVYENTGDPGMDAGYSSLDTPPDVLPQDAVAPYGEFNAPSSTTDKIKNRISGLFQGKRRSQADGGVDESAVYAQPMKKKKKPRKPSIKTPKPKTGSSNSNKAANSAGANGQSSRMEVLHETGPEGDMYAVAMKDVRKK